MNIRAIIALSITYSAFLAEIFGLVSSRWIGVKWKPPARRA